jgi:hypothetical protein
MEQQDVRSRFNKSLTKDICSLSCNTTTAIMKAAEQALRTYGASDLVKEYDESMSAATREKLLDALLNAVRQRLIQYTAAQNMNAPPLRDSGSVPPKKGPPLKNKKCPLVRALVGFGVQRSSLSEDAIEFCREFLQQHQWGRALATRRTKRFTVTT